ncbi:MAG: hypothetical protein H7Y17_15115 [Chlorobia bacterium]|nr:hypothetical protein [Fimbriimonadaceae bacterium]
MLEVVLGLVAAVIGGISVALVVGDRQRRFETRIIAVEKALDSAKQLPVVTSTPPRLLAGLRVALCVNQDHTHPVFATLLKDQLLAMVVSSVEILPSANVDKLKASWGDDSQDILIAGDLTCNGYAEIYFHADFTCYAPNETICTLIERPPHGDRPGNLAIELVDKLNVELEKLVERRERRLAIRELKEG